MRLIVPVGFAVAAAVLVAQIIPARAGVDSLGRNFEFEPAEVVADAGGQAAQPPAQIHAESESHRAFARSFTFEPVVISGRAHKRSLASRSSKQVR